MGDKYYEKDDNDIDDNDDDNDDNDDEEEDGSHTVPVGCWLTAGVNEGVEIFMDSSTSSSSLLLSSSSLSP